MKIKIPKNITLPKFADWIKTNTNCEVRINQKRLEIVVFADNIEKNRCVPLIAYMNGNHLMVTELTDDYFSPEEAWQALDNNAPRLSTNPLLRLGKRSVPNGQKCKSGANFLIRSTS